MFKIKHKELVKFMGNEGGALFHRMKNLNLPIKVAYDVGKVLDLLFKQFEVTKKEYFATVVAEFAISGQEPIPGTNWIKEELKDSFLKAEEAFNELEKEIDWRKLNSKDFEKITFSASELDLLEPLMEFHADGDTPKGPGPQPLSLVV